MIDLAEILGRIAGDLTRLGVPFAVVGGLAVSVRTEPRFTRDIDLAVAVADDAAAEQLVSRLRGRGWAVAAILEQEATVRLAAVRLTPAGETLEGRVVDLLFASSGIEPELIAAADDLAVLPGVRVPVARAGHLVVLKALAVSEDRPQDQMDLSLLIARLDDTERRLAIEAALLVEARGYGRGRYLAEEVRQLVSRGG